MNKLIKNVWNNILIAHEIVNLIVDLESYSERQHVKTFKIEVFPLLYHYQMNV